MAKGNVQPAGEALDAILTGKTGGVGVILTSLTNKVRTMYQAKVKKKTGRLSQSATTRVEKRAVKKGQARLVGVMSVGGTLPVSTWDSPRNTNPGGEFFYGVFHEFGDKGEATAPELSPGQQRKLEGLERLAADSAATGPERKLAQRRADAIRQKGQGRIKKHPAAHDLQAVVKEISIKA